MVEGFDRSSIAPAVGGQVYARGVMYAQQGAVLHLDWDESDRALHAVIRGSGGVRYETSVYFWLRGGAALSFGSGECSCPVGVDCKHVVAAAAAVVASGVRGGAPALSPPRPPSSPPVPAWEDALGALFEPARPRSDEPAYYARNDKSIDLAALSARLWSFFDEAADIGIQIVHARKHLRAIDRYGHAELDLDVTAGESPGSLATAPVLRLAGAAGPDGDRVPVVFLGVEGHGVVHVPRAQAQLGPNPAEWELGLYPGLVEPDQAHLGSAKIDALLEQLGEVVDGGHRALVFSQFTGFLGLVRERLDAAGMSYSYLDGSSRNRPKIVAGFKSGDAPVFLISFKAGGFGLNLTEADSCFLLDPWWNPATEAQVVDRTHRIGQTRKVMVYRLLAKGTIEEKVHALATRKAELFAGVMNDRNVFGSALDADDIRALLA